MNDKIDSLEKLDEALKELNNTAPTFSLDTQKSLEDLQKALEAGKSQTAPLSSTLAIQDLSELANKYLSDKAKEQLSTQRSTMIYEYEKDDKNYFETYISLGLRVRNDLVEEGVKELCEQLNLLAETDLIRGRLGQLVVGVPFAQMFGEAESVAIIAFPFVRAEDEISVKALTGDYYTQEGAAPSISRNTQRNLLDNQFFIELRRGYHLNNDGKTASPVEDDIDQMLAVLPKETKLVSYRELPITGLSHDYELLFESPNKPLNLFQIQFEYARSIAVQKEDGRVNGVTLLTGIKYLDKNGNRIV